MHGFIALTMKPKKISVSRRLQKSVKGDREIILLRSRLTVEKMLATPPSFSLVHKRYCDDHAGLQIRVT